MSAAAVYASTSHGRFTGAVHLTLGASLLGLWMSGTARPEAIAVLAGVLAVAMWRARRGKVPTEREEFVWNLAAMGYLGIYALDLLLLSQNLLGASLRLLMFLSIQRLMAARTHRDRVHLLLISFLGMVAATAATTEFFFALPLALYLVVAVRALACRQLDAAGVPLRDLPGPGRRALAGWVVSILALGTLFFFLIPHVGTGYFRSAGSLSQRLSGFSDRIELGSINGIKKNHELALRVRLDGPVPQGAPLRWRGLAFDEYDGSSWKRTSSQAIGLTRGRGTQFRLQPPSGVPTVVYDISMEPMGTQALFAAADPVLLETRHFRNVFRSEGTIRLEFQPRSRVRYRATSELRSSELLGDRLRGAGRDYPEDVRDRYLRLPALDGRIRDLARQMAGSAVDPYDVVRNLQRGLMRDYTYSLEVNDRGVADPLARFLIEKAPGHCEYFATSLAVMARQQGIPSRVVAGFLQGEYSDLQSAYLVRQSDAHSWVEVYFPGHGWVGFDPTPPVPVTAAGSIASRMRRLMEQMEIAWDTWVVGLDLNDQASILGTVRDFASGAASRLTGALGATLRSAASMRRVAWVTLGLMAVGLVLETVRRNVPFLRDRLRLWRPRPVQPGESDRLLDMYRRFLRALERQGIRRGPHMTPLEFARQAGEPSGRSEQIREVTDLFCRARYSGSGLTTDEVRRVESLITLLQA
jgi:hypothetical protein